ncbi:MAG: adenylate kinase [Flavobacteriales bacterium]|jgi:adenylate kinase|nr:adenylate kinase [Flavobacteriales bacterium]|tara:strand:- start:879 stop:1457 length:579 start_codon:yes stop_codon:yes gene_type:complete
MKNIILFGPPGSGKGTQAELLMSELKLNHISTGDVFRNNIKNSTNLGKLAAKYMDSGQLVPDEVTIDLLSSELEKFPQSKGFIFDGFPRTIDQAHAFDALFKKKDLSLDMVLSLEVSEDELVARLLKRGISSGRKDDQNKDVILNRIQVYNQQTSILKSYYLEKLNNSFFSIDGERDVSLIFNDINSIVSNY